MDSETKLRREVRVLAVGLVVLAVVVGILARRITNPPDPQEVVITDGTGTERIILSCRGGVPSVTMFDQKEDVAIILLVEQGKPELGLRDGEGAMRWVDVETLEYRTIPFDGKQYLGRSESVKRSAGE